MTQNPLEKVYNGTFTEGLDGWFSTASKPASVEGGELRVDVSENTTNRFDIIVGQNDIPLQHGKEYTLSFRASASQPVQVNVQVQRGEEPFLEALSLPVTLGADQPFTKTFTCDIPSTAKGQVAFHIGGNPAPWMFRVHDVSLVGGDPVRPYVPNTGPRVRVNQVGYLPAGPKRATIVTDAPAPVPWEVRTHDDFVIASGMSTPRDVDTTSGQRVHTVDFSHLTEPGTDYTLTADGQTSYPFEISGTLYDQLRSDALHFFYTQRSGIAIDDVLAPGYARPAGHMGVPPNQGDTDVPCQPGAGSHPPLDVHGGWYDAGDHGKYVVNGGIATYQLLSQYERTLTAAVVQRDALGDNRLRLPERGNHVPDVLDEARWELEFLLRMQVPAGNQFEGMAHHKVHDQTWTGLALLPSDDPRPRELHRPSTAATLNLAAVAAQAARLYGPFDQGFATRCLDAARRAWAAAHANPIMKADPNDSVGGGAYPDDDLTDEFYWAAAELFITTGEQPFLDAVHSSPLDVSHPENENLVFPLDGFDWSSVAALGRLDLAAVPNKLPDSDRGAARVSVQTATEKYIQQAQGQPYGMPVEPNEYVWGSNGALLNKLVVMATTFDLTGNKRYRDAALEGLDYLFGRNALNQSYVTGHGTHYSHNQHSRLYSHELKQDFPPPPDGAIAGGPNSALQDPKAQKTLSDRKDRPQLCYIDDIESYSTNEVAINWNSALSWVVSFAADQRAG